MKTSRLPVFTERFNKLRGDMTLDEFSKKIGLNRNTAGLYASGKRIPDAVTVRQIAESCNVSADYLLGLFDEPTPDRDMRMICKYTGLSEDAIEKLTSTWQTRIDSPSLQPCHVVEYLLNCPDNAYSFNESLMWHVQDAFQARSHRSNWGEDLPVEDERLQEAIELLVENGFVYMPQEDASEMYIERAVSSFREILKALIDDAVSACSSTEEVDDHGNS